MPGSSEQPEKRTGLPARLRVARLPVPSRQTGGQAPDYGRPAGMEIACILLVEDDPLVAWMVPHALAKEGYILIIVADGRQALRVLERDLPDLILSDLRLPRMDGWALFQEVQERYPQVPFIAMSGHSDSVEAIKKGFDAFIQKPFDIQYLVITVGRIIREAKQKEQD